MSQNMNFGRNTVRKTGYLGIVSILIMTIVIGVTMAFFFADDYASKHLGLSGAVKIIAVGNKDGKVTGADDVYIEDDENCNLKISLQDGFDRLIPGMQISMPANVLVYKSTTKPLIRARIDMEVLSGSLDSNDAQGIGSDIYNKLSGNVIKNKWYFHNDGYFYYVGDVVQTSTGENTVLAEVDATAGNVVLKFIDDTVEFPTYVTESYSGIGVKFTITFQAIQNFIPDNAGVKMSNTIKNSLKIFNTFDTDNMTTTSLSLFDIETSPEGVRTIKLKDGVTYPETIVLPQVDARANPITVIDSSFSTLSGVKKLIIPSGYTTIEPQTFLGTSLETIDMTKSSISQIEANCFKNSSLKSIFLPRVTANIGANAFSGSNIEELYIYGDLSDSALAGMSKLKKVTVLFDTDNVGNNSFKDCPLLQSVIFKNNIPPTFASANIFTGTTSQNFKIYVPDRFIESYKSVPNFNDVIKNKIYPLSTL